jgi:hypothetical protein
MATTQHVGVGRDGHVTGLIRDDFIDLDKAKVICSDPAELEGFVGEGVLARDVAGWLFVLVMTPDVIGSPPIPVCVLRRTSGAANNAVLECLKHLLSSLRAFGLRVTRVTADGDRKFGTFLRPGWEALRDPLRWEFARPIHVLGVCVHLVIHGELASEERLRAAEYGLAVAVATTWHRSHVPADLRAGEIWRGGVA